MGSNKTAEGSWGTDADGKGCNKGVAGCKENKKEAEKKEPVPEDAKAFWGTDADGKGCNKGVTVCQENKKEMENKNEKASAADDNDHDDKGPVIEDVHVERQEDVPQNV